MPSLVAPNGATSSPLQWLVDMATSAWITHHHMTSHDHRSFRTVVSRQVIVYPGSQLNTKIP